VGFLLLSSVLADLQVGSWVCLASAAVAFALGFVPQEDYWRPFVAASSNLAAPNLASYVPRKTENIVKISLRKAASLQSLVHFLPYFQPLLLSSARNKTDDRENTGATLCYPSRRSRRRYRLLPGTGPLDPPVVLLLHGFPSSSFQSRERIPRLADRFRVIASGLPGFGFTEVPEQRHYRYTFDLLAATILAFKLAPGRTDRRNQRSRRRCFVLGRRPFRSVRKSC
jgi:alpha/beta hydrolase family protein